jgi:DNA polymerase-3 subunit delta
MKIPARNIDSFVKKPDAMAVLVYGPDEGLVRERLNVMTKSVVADIHDPFNVVEFSGSALAESPSRLLDEAQSISMLGGRRVIRVREASDKITPMVKEALAALRKGDNLILLEADSLTPRSSLRLLFEHAENAAALPCYVDDERSIGRVISDSLREAGFSFSADVVSCLAANVVGDRGVARSEVEKLITYMGGKKSISLDDAIACIGNSASLPLDDLSGHVASGRFAEADRILDFVLSEGIPAVTVLRTLQNHFTRLHATRARMQNGESMEAAMAKLRPAVFFKQKPAFEQQLNGWSMGQMEQALALLVSAEAKCKQTGAEPHTICGRALLSLAQAGAKATGARRRAY